MTSKLTREWLQHQISEIEVAGITDSNTLAAFKLALAAMGSEPVAWEVKGILCHTLDEANKYVGTPEPLYRHAQPAPIAPEGLRLALSNAGIAAPESDEMLAAHHEKYTQALVDWVRDRKAFWREPVVPEILPCSVELKPGLVLDRGCKTTTLLTALRSRADYLTEIDAMTPEERAEHDASIEAFKVILNGGLS